MLKQYNDFPENDTALTITGPAGTLEAYVSVAKEPSIAATVIVCHPHPLMGGTMNNKVVTTLTRTFKGMGIHAVRFNYRGVGASEGEFAEGIGETDDVLAVMAWVKQCRPHDQLWLAGFSFGAYVTLRASNQQSVAQLLSVAPPVFYPGFAKIQHPGCPWLVLQGDQDEVVSAEQVYEWVKQYSPPPEVIRFASVGHFFHGHLIELRDQVQEYYARVKDI